MLLSYSIDTHVTYVPEQMMTGESMEVIINT